MLGHVRLWVQSFSSHLRWKDVKHDAGSVDDPWNAVFESKDAGIKDVELLKQLITSSQKTRGSNCCWLSDLPRLLFIPRFLIRSINGLKENHAKTKMMPPILMVRRVHECLSAILRCWICGVGFHLIAFVIQDWSFTTWEMRAINAYSIPESWRRVAVVARRAFLVQHCHY